MYMLSQIMAQNRERGHQKSMVRGIVRLFGREKDGFDGNETAKKVHTTRKQTKTNNVFSSIISNILIMQKKQFLLAFDFFFRDRPLNSVNPINPTCPQQSDNVSQLIITSTAL